MIEQFKDSSVLEKDCRLASKPRRFFIISLRLFNSFIVLFLWI